MASLGWYVQRARTMGPGELIWRMRNAARDRADRLLLPVRRRWLSWAPADGERSGPEQGLLAAAARQGHAPASYPEAWRARLLAKAERIRDHRLDLFDLHNVSLGDPIDWNRDVKTGRTCPRCFAPRIDYRDAAHVGDCKFVWEPSRHHQWVVLGRAYCLTGRHEFAQAAVGQMESWLAQCPFECGMQWRSPLELGVRLINWSVAWELLASSGLLKGRLAEQMGRCVYRQVWEIARKYSRGSSANNHLVGEAAGVFVTTCSFPVMPHAGRYRRQAREILEREILRQTHADGGSREQAVGYHLFAFQLFLLAARAGAACGEPFSEAFLERLGRMAEFLAVLQAGGPLPMFGDCDDGYVLDLGGEPRDARQWLAVAALLWQREEFAPSPARGETAWWMLGPKAPAYLASLAGTGQPAQPLASRALTSSGYYLLQCGTGERRISATFDAGPLGMAPLSAHGHADALSVTLRVGGRAVLVDPGTYDYFSYPAWRRYFRSTRAHNTVTVAGQDQACQRGPFLWGPGPAVCVHRWEPAAGGGGRVAAEHDGYMRLADPVVHARTLQLDGARSRLSIRDDLRGRGTHEVEVNFHFAPECRLRSLGENSFGVAVSGGPHIRVELDPQFVCEVAVGRDGERPAGWFSSGYHCKQPTNTLTGRCRMNGPRRLTSRFQIVW